MTIDHYRGLHRKSIVLTRVVYVQVRVQDVGHVLKREAVVAELLLQALLF